MRFKSLLSFLLLSLFSFCQVSMVLAQATTSLGGRVTDSSGAIIPGATVKLTLTTTGATRINTTDNSGEYQFSQLTPGRYTLTVNAAGFAAAEKTNMQNAVPRQRLAMEIVVIGAENRKLVCDAPSTTPSVPPAWENAYQMKAAVTSGITQAATTIVPTERRIAANDRCISSARISPNNVWPMIPDPTTKISVSSIE